jgi:hypothetical protein
MEELRKVNFALDDLPHDLLLALDSVIGIDDNEIEFRAHGEVLLENTALENFEAFIGIGREVEIHTGLEVFQLWTPIENALKGNFELGLKEKSDVWMGGVIIDTADPLGRTTADDVAGKSGEYVTIAEDDITGAQERNELAFVTVGKVGGMDEAEGGGSEKFALFTFAGGAFDKRGGIPFAEENFQPFEFEPSLQEIDLRGLAGTIQSFNGDEASGKAKFSECLHQSL